VNLAVFIWNNDRTQNAADFVEIADVQLEKGPICTDYERRPFAIELTACQRYYEALGTGASGPAIIGLGQVISATQINTLWVFKVRKRTNVAALGVSGTFLVSGAGSFLNLGSTYGSFLANGLDSVALQFTSSTLTAGQASMVGTDGSSFLTASAEL